jgi:hypothetical protein
LAKAESGKRVCAAALSARLACYSIEYRAPRLILYFAEKDKRQAFRTGAEGGQRWKGKDDEK